MLTSTEQWPWQQKVQVSIDLLYRYLVKRERERESSETGMRWSMGGVNNTNTMSEREREHKAALLLPFPCTASSLALSVCFSLFFHILKMVLRDCHVGPENACYWAPVSVSEAHGYSTCSTNTIRYHYYSLCKKNCFACEICLPLCWSSPNLVESWKVHKSCDDWSLCSDSSFNYPPQLFSPLGFG